ncbi:Slc22a18 [Symbiodinium sp. CCMP2592]|nr:Slc22a18 [Symbiodinium sp. CCMP2592]
MAAEASSSSKGSAAQRYRDFIVGSAPPRSALVAAVQGVSEAPSENPQGGDPASTSPIADFLFVRQTEASVRRAVVAHAGNVIYAVAHEMVQIVLPYVNKEVGGDVISFSNYRTAVNSLLLFGGVGVGKLADRAGPKVALMAAHAASASKFFLVASATNLRSLYLSALPAALMHAFQVTLHVATLNSEDDQRAAALGRVGALYGIGFLAGSGLVVGVLSVLGFKVVLASSAGSICFMLQQFAMEPFGFHASEVAMLMAYVGLLQIASQSLIPASAAPRELYATSAVTVAGSLLGLGLMPASKHGFVLWLAPLMLSFHSANTALGSLLTFYVPESELGTVIGLSVATMPLSSILAVQAAGHIFKRHGFAAVPLSSAGFLLAASALIFAFGWLPPSEGSEMEVEEVQDPL